MACKLQGGGLPEAQVLSQILEALYEAPLDSSRWGEFLKLVAASTSADAAALMMHDFEHPQSLVAQQSGLDPQEALRYEQHYGTVDVWRAAGTTKTSNWLGPSECLVPVAELRQTEFYNDFLLPSGISHAVFSFIERSPSKLVNLSIYRGLGADAFAEEELELARFLTPHIRRAYRLNSELTAARGHSAGLLAALDTLPTGVILVGPLMQVVTMNRAAERIATTGDLQISRLGLRTERVSESSTLQKLLAEAILTSQGDGLDSAGAMTVSRRDLPPLQVLVAPVRGWDLDDTHLVRAIVFISDSTQRVRPDSNALRAMFGLTPAECRLAMLLADGNSLIEIADTLGLTRNTVKSQLASIYGKTATSRQSQLVRLFLLLQVTACPSWNKDGVRTC